MRVGVQVGFLAVLAGMEVRGHGARVDRGVLAGAVVGALAWRPGFRRPVRHLSAVPLPAGLPSPGNPAGVVKRFHEVIHEDDLPGRLPTLQQSVGLGSLGHRERRRDARPECAGSGQFPVVPLTANSVRH